MVLLKDKQWFNVNLFIEIFEPFKADEVTNEIGALIQELSLSKNGTDQLISFSSILDKSLKGINNEKTTLLSNIMNLGMIYLKTKNWLWIREMKLSIWRL